MVRARVCGAVIRTVITVPGLSFLRRTDDVNATLPPVGAFNIFLRPAGQRRLRGPVQLSATVAPRGSGPTVIALNVVVALNEPLKRTAGSGPTIGPTGGGGDAVGEGVGDGVGDGAAFAVATMVPLGSPHGPATGALFASPL